MASSELEFDVLRDLLEEAEVADALAKDEQSFLGAYQAFRALDPKAFQGALQKAGLLARCHRVCRWIRSKECIFLCLELCGPPKPFDRAPDPRLLAEAVVRITKDTKALDQLVEAVEKRDQRRFQQLVTAHELGPVCHLFCHWVCYVHYRLVCRWICGPLSDKRPDLRLELQMAGEALRGLLEHRRSFDEAVAASNAGDAEKLGAAIRDAELFHFCYFICEWFCSWRCTLVCLTLCRHLPLPAIDNPLKEAREFALAIQQLAQQSAEVRQLSVAVGAGDAKAYAAIIERFKLQRYCIQLCHWICGLRCRRFCLIVCPPIFNHPWFTHVGDFDIYGDIDPGTGLTNKMQAGHGGPDYGFFGCLKLRGFCPKTSPTFAGQPMAYRFLFKGAVETPITGGFVCEVLVGSRYAFWNGNPFTLQSVRIKGTGATSPTPPTPGPGLTPPDHYIVPDPQGWIAVDPNALDDGFNGWLNGFASWVAFPGGAAAPGVTAGTAVPLANQKNGVDAAIIFQATRVSTIAAVNGGAAPDYTNQLAKIRINNWDEVNLIDLQEFLGPGATACSPLTNDLHILYTTDHELLADWSIDMVTAAAVAPAPVFPSGVGPRGAAGSDFHDISTWPSCSYLIRLHTRRSLTDGLIDDSDKWNFKTFCIGKKNGNSRPR